MGLDFKNMNIYQMGVDKFSGIDLTNKNRSHLTASAVFAENVFINDEGEIEKRTGFKSLFESEEEENFNGAYLYKHGADMKFYILHIGGALYETDENFQTRRLIYSSISDSPSKGFSFGDGFYIMCDGYYKISYIDEFECLGVGRVCDVYKKHYQDSQIIVSQRSKGLLDGVSEIINFEYGFHTINYKNSRYYFDKGIEGYDKLYIAKREAWDKVRVVSLDMGGYTIKAYNYEVLRDDKGVYIKLYRKNDGVREYYDCSPSVCIEITGFVYAPKYIVSRTPVDVSEIMGSVGDEVDDSQKYNGVYTEDLNLAASVRKINFFVDFSLYNSSYLRFYLDSGEDDGEVLMIRAGCEVINCYIEQEDAYGTADIVFANGNRYVDIKKSVLKNISGGDDIAVEIEYFNYSECNDIDKCDIFGFFGGENDTRVFVSGNDDKPSCDFESGCFEGSYFPALAYTKVGNDCSRILGYGRYFSYQLVLKDGTGDSQMYFRIYNEESGYKILKGNMAVSPLNKNAIANVNSRLFVLAKDGLYSVEQTAVEGECKCVMRSEEINGLLKRENEERLFLAEACGMLMIFGEEKIYVLDILKDYSWYIYSMPKKFFAVEKSLENAFLHDRGIMRIADKNEDMAYFECGKPVKALWQTNFVCFYPKKRRDILSAYCCLSECETARSGAEILYSCDDYDLRSAVLKNRDLFSFEDIDFSRFSFCCVRNGRMIRTHLRSKRVEKISITVRNEKGEPFKVNQIGFLYR